MDFYEILDQVVELLRSRQRVTYRTLKRQFDLDDTALEDLKEGLLFTHPQIVDEDGRGLVWAVETPPAPQRLASMPHHLAEKILTSRSTLTGERKQVTVLFADLKGSMELLADRDPEEARQLLDPVLTLMMDAVHRYEGTVNQVIGTDVSFLLLQALGEIPEASLHGALTHLQAAEFLYEARLFPDLEYTFKHALTQQVAYESLLRERRRALRAHIVEATEALVGDRIAEQVERLWGGVRRPVLPCLPLSNYTAPWI